MTDPDYSDLERLMADARLVHRLGLITSEELEEIAAYVAAEATRRMAHDQSTQGSTNWATRRIGE
jgi:hypothetical protein